MEEQLIQQITDRAHISEQQARDALNAVLDFVRQNVPALAPYLGMLGGSGGSTAATNSSGAATSSSGSGGNLLGEAEGALGGLFGGNKEQGK